MSEIQTYSFVGDDVFPDPAGGWVTIRTALTLAAQRDALRAENERLRAALDVIADHRLQYPWGECARIGRAALAESTEAADGHKAAQ